MAENGGFHLLSVSAVSHGPSSLAIAEGALDIFDYWGKEKEKLTQQLPMLPSSMQESPFARQSAAEAEERRTARAKKKRTKNLSIVS